MSCRLGRLGCGGLSAERDVKGVLWEPMTAEISWRQRFGRSGTRRTITRNNLIRSVRAQEFHVGQSLCIAIQN